MGSHVATTAANYYTRHVSLDKLKRNSVIGEKIGRRTSLAPLGLGFDSLAYVDNAKYIDVIHTSVIQDPNDDPRISILKRQFGYKRNEMGDGFPNQIDFYPNDGMPDDHCPPDSSYGCSLNLAIAFFKASLRNGYDRERFLSYPYHSFIRVSTHGLAEWNPGSETETMGIDAFDKRNRAGGDYRLQIKLDDVRQPPFKAENNVRGLEDCNQIPAQVSSPTGDYPGCGKQPEILSRIYKGLNATEKQYPWSVCIQIPKFGYKTTDFDAHGNIRSSDQLFRQRNDVHNPFAVQMVHGFEPACSGSLIQPGWVLTAAHCFYQFKSGVPIYLIFGATNCEIPNEPRVQTVRRVIIEKRKGLSTQTFFYAGDFPISHPRIDDPKNHDIVLIRLVDPVIPSLKNNINPICYHAAAKYRYGDCSQITTAGYGLKGRVDDPFLTWMGANIIEINNPKHAFLDKPKYGIKHNIISNVSQLFGYGNFEDHDGAEQYGRDSCGGDSGGPVMDYHLLQNNAATLIGVHNAGTLTCHISKSRKSRKEFDNSYAGEDPDEQIWLIELSYAIVVGQYVKWIDETILYASTNATKKPLDVKRGELGMDPKFGPREYDPTPRPPAESEASLLD